jgi:hypothetical protein
LETNVTVTPHYLGHCTGSRVRKGGGPNTPEVHHVFAVWIDGIDVDRTDGSLLSALEILRDGGYQCPQCGAAWPLERQWGCIQSVREASSRVVKVSDTCKGCAALVHFDATPPERRPRLKWINMYEKRPDVVGDRLDVYPCPWEQ